jgi:ketosteroid isomerase-like protein
MTEDSVRVVSEFFERMNTGGDIFALTADGYSWWAAGVGEVQGRFGEIGEALGGQLDGGMTMEVKGITAQGERVAVETESLAKLKNGRVFNNQYHFLFVVKDGKITSIKEYNDTAHANATWADPGGGPSLMPVYRPETVNDYREANGRLKRNG